MNPGAKGPTDSSPPPGGAAPPSKEGRHLSRALLDAYVTGERSVTEVLRKGLEHLAGSTVHEVPARGRATADRLVRQVERSLRADPEQEARERAAAREQVDGLLLDDPLDALAAVRRERRLQTLAVGETLLDWAWYCLESRAPEMACRALELAHATLRAIDPARYGEGARLRAWAFREVLVARVELAEGDLEAARSGLEAAAGLAEAVGRPPPAEWAEVELGLFLAHLGSLLCHRHKVGDAVVLQEVGARDLAMIARWAGRWAPAFAANLGWVARRRTGPQAAIRWLTPLLDAGEVSPTLPSGPPSAVWAVRELLWSLAAAGRVEEGAQRLAGWTEPGAGEPGPDRAERLQVAGSFWARAGGPPELAGPPLEQAYRLFLTTGRGLDAAITALELFRLYRGLGRERGAVEAMTHLEGIAHAPDVPGAVLAALARFAERAACATVGDHDLDAMEDLLIATRAGWGPPGGEHA